MVSWLEKRRLDFSRCSRPVVVKKCTKKRNSRAKLLICYSKSIAFLKFSLPSPYCLGQDDVTTLICILTPT